MLEFKEINVDDLDFNENAKFMIKYTTSDRFSNGSCDPRGCARYKAKRWSTIGEVRNHLDIVGKGSYKNAYVVVWDKSSPVPSYPRWDPDSPYNANVACIIPIIPGK